MLRAATRVAFCESYFDKPVHLSAAARLATASKKTAVRSMIVFFIEILQFFSL